MDTKLSAALFCFITIMAVPGNSLVMFTVLLNKRLHQGRYLFLASLAFSDFLFQFFVNVFKTASLGHREWIFGHRWCQISSIIAEVCYRSTMLHLCAITLEVAMPLIRPFHYQRKITKTKLTCLVCLWFVPAVLSATGWKYKVYNPNVYGCQPDWSNDALVNKANVLGSAVVFFAIPLIIIASLHFVMWRISRKFTALVPTLVNDKESGLPRVNHFVYNVKKGRAICDQFSPTVPKQQAPQKIIDGTNSMNEEENTISRPQEDVETIFLGKTDEPYKGNLVWHGNSMSKHAQSHLRQTEGYSETERSKEVLSSQSKSETKPDDDLTTANRSKIKTTLLAKEHFRNKSVNCGSAESRKETKSVDTHSKNYDFCSSCKKIQLAKVCGESFMGSKSHILKDNSKPPSDMQFTPGSISLEQNFLHPGNIKKCERRIPVGWRNRNCNLRLSYTEPLPFIEEMKQMKTPSGKRTEENICNTETETKSTCLTIEAEIHFEVDTRQALPPNSTDANSFFGSRYLCSDVSDGRKENVVEVIDTKISDSNKVHIDNNCSKTNRKDINMVEGNLFSCRNKVNRSIVSKENSALESQDIEGAQYSDMENNNTEFEDNLNEREVAKGKRNRVHVKQNFGSCSKKRVKNITYIKHYKKDLRASRDIFIVTSVFIFCFLPLWFAGLYQSKRGYLSGDVQLMCQWFAFASTFCNPIIYCIRKREFRRALEQLARHVRKRKASSMNNST